MEEICTPCSERQLCDSFVVSLVSNDLSGHHFEYFFMLFYHYHKKKMFFLEMAQENVSGPSVRAGAQNPTTHGRGWEEGQSACAQCSGVWVFFFIFYFLFGDLLPSS